MNEERRLEMKSRNLLILSACCLLISLGLFSGLISFHRAQAQSISSTAYLFNLKLAEDFLRQHGRQIKSYSKEVPEGVGQPAVEYVDTVPPNRRFIVTDVIAQYPGIVWLMSGQDTAVKVAFNMESSSRLHSKMLDVAGIVFEPNEKIYVAQNSPSDNFITISGYFVVNP